MSRISLVSFVQHLMNAVLVLLMLFLVTSAYAGKVIVTNPENNKGEKFVVGELEEEGKFYHDRDYTVNYPRLKAGA